ncbi:MAG: hypothetical protein ABSE83_10670 [Methanobacterium sp.]
MPSIVHASCRRKIPLLPAISSFTRSMPTKLPELLSFAAVRIQQHNHLRYLLEAFFNMNINQVWPFLWLIICYGFIFANGNSRFIEFCLL